MKTQLVEMRIVSFDNEGKLQDVLNPANIGAQSTRDSLKRELAKGPVIIRAPGHPDRALVKKEIIETLTGGVIHGGDLIVLPFA